MTALDSSTMHDLQLAENVQPFWQEILTGWACIWQTAFGANRNVWYCNLSGKPRDLHANEHCLASFDWPDTMNNAYLGQAVDMSVCLDPECLK